MQESPESLSPAGLGATLAGEESRWLGGLGESPFQGWHTAAYRADPNVRARIFEDAITALRGFHSGSNRAWHEADWLRCHAYLWFDLSPTRLEQAAAWERQVLCAQAPELVEAFDGLTTGLAPAFEGLRRLNKLGNSLPGNHETLNGSEAYWDACAHSAPLVTIDWACFDRADLFDQNGRRAAEWLLSEGGIRPGHTVLQVGCGIGRIERHLAGRVAEVIGVDSSREMIERGKRWLGASPVSLRHTNGVSTGLPDASVDRAFAVLVFIHIHAPQTRTALVSDLHRTLKPGGRFWFSLDEFRLNQEGGVDAADAVVRDAAGAAGFREVHRTRVSSRAINSFGFEWDWRWELIK